ncbi:hypothetical protein PVC01_140005100 [Plasmodium vivax]|uniref:VIR protein n=1 Tax=Plasmodium vivax TaxID=5855 RepID=A0A1G4HJE7_PLAVI|nr:hypothetical protein PVC01_140005100 [Plasmodium vivax]
MAPWPGISSRINDHYRKYLQPHCMTKYNNIHKQILNQIEALNNKDPGNFCKNCQALRLNINNKNNELNYCYAPNILGNKLIDDYDINAFMKKCLPLPKCSYNGASNVRKPSTLKREPENECRERNKCNKGITSSQVSAGKVKPEINYKSPETKLPIRKEDLNITQPHAGEAGSTKANTHSGPQNNISNPNNPVVVQHGAPHSKGIDPSGTTEHEYIPKQPASASPNSLTSVLGNSSEDSSPHVTPGSEPSTTAIAQQKNLETSSHERDQRSLQQINGNPLGAQGSERATSAGEGLNIKVLDSNISGTEDLDEISPDGRNPRSSVVHQLVDSIINLDGDPSLYSTLTDAAAGGDNYLNGGSLETSVSKPLIGEFTGDNPEIKYKNYTAMALAPTGVIMLMTLLSKVNQIVFH